MKLADRDQDKWKSKCSHLIKVIDLIEVVTARAAQVSAWQEGVWVEVTSTAGGKLLEKHLY